MKTYNLADIIADERFQTRVTLDTDLVEEYAERLDDGATLPPVELAVIDGATYIVDGFHRYAAHLRAGKKTIEGEATKRTEAQAIARACAANAEHGLRRSNADKRKAVRMYLKAFPVHTDRKAAAACGVSHPFVGLVRHEITVEEAKAAGAVAPTKPKKDKKANDSTAGGNGYQSEGSDQPAEMPEAGSFGGSEFEPGDFEGLCPHCRQPWPSR